MKITVKQLVNLNACEKGIQWFISQKKCKLKSVINALLKDNHFDYASWLLSKLLTKKQNILWAIKSAESSLNMFEMRFPDDSRPRYAIEITKKFIEDKYTREELRDALNYADNAVKVAVNCAYHLVNATNVVNNGVNAAVDAAIAVYHAIYAAYTIAVNDANTGNDNINSVYAAVHARAVDAANNKKQKKIEVCNFALRILGEIK